MKRPSLFIRSLAVALCLVMVLTAAPLIAFAADPNPNSLTVASASKAQLAPGVTETTVVSYDSHGDRVKYWYVNANIADYDTVQFKANYTNNDNTGNWAKSTVVEQANAATAKRGYNVVVSQNASYYNVTTGQPTGAFVMEGVQVNNESAGNATEFFAIMKDGTAMIGKRGTWSQYMNDVVEAIGGYKLLVWDGAVVAGLDTASKYPRSTIGVTAEGNIVAMLADGNQKPASAGLTYAEQAQLMLELGCVAAVELDGGGSATYASKYEGENEITVRNNCCDGTVRSVSNTFMIISTAVADGTFDHANLSTEYAYYTANSEVVINASGADAGGHAAEIPENISWALSDDSFGTVADGVFTSTGKLGTVAVNMLYNDAVVGSIDVTVVTPTSVAFSADEKTIPYGKTADLSITAMYNGAEVFADVSAFDFVCTAGSMNGFDYTATSDETITSAAITATYKYAEALVAAVKINFGKGSEVLFDFEGGEEDAKLWGEFHDLQAAAEREEYTGGYLTQYVADGPYQSSNQVIEGIHENVFLASEENGGKVHNGKYSLGYTFDYRQQVDYCDWLYGYLYYWGEPIVLRDVANGITGTRIGMWMYIPEEAVGSCSRLAYTYKTAAGTMDTAYLYMTYQYVKKGFSKITSDKIPEAGWAYVYVDLDDISTSYVSTTVFGHRQSNPGSADYAPAFIQWIISSSATGAEKVTFYIDDITLDFSDAVDDRDAPVISGITYADESMTDAAVLNGQTTNYSKIDFAASVAEDTAHNFTAVDASTAAVYIDGIKVASKYTANSQFNGVFAASAILPDGTHDITFEIADKQGNYVKTTKQIVVDAGSSYPSVKVNGEKMNGAADIKCGEQYNINITTNKAESIDTVTATIWLNSASTWALEHMMVAQGFKAEYTLDDIACKATVTLTNTDSTLSGDAVLATIPVYNFAYDGTSGVDAHTHWVSKNTAPILTLSWDVLYGAVTYTDGYGVSAENYVAGFGKGRTDERTELNTSIANLKNTIGEWHYHTEEAIADKTATCTESGFVGRTVCTGCNSIINWGTTLPATGHTFVIIEGVLKCSCGDLFNGIYTDGKLYVDGVVVADGWNGDSYYVDGVKLTGIQLIDGLYYDLGEDGISKGRYIGFLNDGKGFKYVVNGTIVNKWQMIDDEYYYFSSSGSYAVHGTKTINGVTYEFENNGKLKHGVWVETEKGKKYYYGPKCYIADGNGNVSWAEIDGKTYGFDKSGYCYTGIHALIESNASSSKIYQFDENGVCLGYYTGIYNMVYYKESVATYAGVVEFNGDLYYATSGGKIKTGEVFVYTSKTNGLLDAGAYIFGEDGKLIGAKPKTGVYDGFYYVEDVKTYAGLVEFEGHLYYATSGGRIKTGTFMVYGSRANGLVPPGEYTFDETGKMIVVTEKKNGVIDGYYYVDDVKTYAGLVEFKGGLYYATSGGRIKTGTFMVYGSRANGLVPAGEYTFDETGKMVIVTEKKNGVIDGYYYVDDVKTYAGLVEFEGGLYYATSGGKIKTGTFMVYGSRANGLVAPGEYTFDSTGRMITQ